jgi:hypothetical protein
MSVKTSEMHGNYAYAKKSLKISKGQWSEAVKLYPIKGIISPLKHEKWKEIMSQLKLTRIILRPLPVISDLRQVGGFLRMLRFPPPIKLTDITEILLQMEWNTIKQTNKQTNKHNLRWKKL